MSKLTMVYSFTPARQRARGSERAGEEVPSSTPAGRTPRVTRLMALAIKFDALIRDGAVRDQEDPARLGFVTRARMTQIMALLNLAPDIQEQLLFLPRTTGNRDAITERHLRRLTRVAAWTRQRRLFDEMLKTARV